MVEGVNIQKRHMRPTRKNTQGGVIERPGPLAASNVLLVCPHCKRAVAHAAGQRTGRAASCGVLQRGAARRCDVTAWEGDGGRRWGRMSRLQEKYRERSGAGPDGTVRIQERHAGAAGSKKSCSTWAWAKRRRTRRSWSRPCEDLAAITGQKPAVTRAKKSVAAFKIREGMAIGCNVTLRGERMYDFLDKLIHMAPAAGCGTSAACRPGHSTGGATTASGLREQLVFPEMRSSDVDKMRGLDVTIVTTAEDRRGSLRAA